jgi:hypothetical protein
MELRYPGVRGLTGPALKPPLIIEETPSTPTTTTKHQATPRTRPRGTSQSTTFKAGLAEAVTIVSSSLLNAGREGLAKDGLSCMASFTLVETPLFGIRSSVQYGEYTRCGSKHGSFCTDHGSCGSKRKRCHAGSDAKERRFNLRPFRAACVGVFAAEPSVLL